MKRVSKAELQKLVDKVAKLQGRPSAELSRNDKGDCVTNIGALHLDHNSAYGGWDLLEYTNEHVCDSSIIGNTFGGRGRLSSHEMETFLLGMLTALEGSRYWPLEIK